MFFMEANCLPEEVQVMRPDRSSLGQYRQFLAMHFLSIFLDSKTFGSLGGVGILACTSKSLRFWLRLLPKMILFEKRVSVVLVLPKIGQLSLTISLSGDEVGLTVLMRYKSSLGVLVFSGVVGFNRSSRFSRLAMIMAFSTTEGG